MQRFFKFFFRIRGPLCAAQNKYTVRARNRTAGLYERMGMMGFFEDTFIKAKDVFETVGEKGGELISVQKLKIEAAKAESQISKNYATLGRVVYSNLKNGCAAGDGCDALVQAIDDDLAALETIQKKIADEKGLTFCPSCGDSNPNDAVYCSKCGAKLRG